MNRQFNMDEQLLLFGMKNLLLEKSLEKLENSGIEIGHSNTLKKDELVDVELFEHEILKIGNKMADFYLNTPLSDEDIRQLKIGDTVFLSGDIFLSRDEAHERALEYYNEGRELPIPVKGLAVYHCGPVVRKRNGDWEVVAAGPTTSIKR